MNKEEELYKGTASGANEQGKPRQAKAYKPYTSAVLGTAKEQADAQAKRDRAANKLQPVKSLENMSVEEKAALEAKYNTKKTEELKEGEVTNPDGSVFRFEGEEPLKKPKSKKSLKERWKVLKSELSNSGSFLNMLEDDEDGDQGSDDKDPNNTDGSAVPASDSQGGEDSDQPDVADDSRMPSANPGVASSVGDELDQPQDTEQQDPQPDTASQQPEADDQQQDQPYSQDETIQLLKEEGYSDSEIAYIVHHQVPAQPTKEELKHAESVQDLKHKGAKQDQELDHKDQHHDIDVDHKKRMTDLEFEHAKKEKELRLKYLEHELQAKIEAMKAKAKSGE